MYTVTGCGAVLTRRHIPGLVCSGRSEAKMPGALLANLQLDRVARSSHRMPAFGPFAGALGSRCDGPLLAGDRLWALAPNCGPSPICPYFSPASVGIRGEPRLSRKSRRSANQDNGSPELKNGPTPLQSVCSAGSEAARGHRSRCCAITCGLSRSEVRRVIRTHRPFRTHAGRPRSRSKLLPLIHRPNRLASLASCPTLRGAIASIRQPM